MSEIAATMEGELVSPEGIQDRNSACHLVAIKLQPFPMVRPEEAQDVKTDYCPQIVEWHIKGMISVSLISCNFLYIEKH